MDKKEFIKAVEEQADLKELTKGRSYIIQVEIGDMPQDQAFDYLTKMSNKLKELGLADFLITPVSDGVRALKFYEIKDQKLIEV